MVLIALGWHWRRGGRLDLAEAKAERDREGYDSIAYNTDLLKIPAGISDRGFCTSGLKSILVHLSLSK